jgi:hypothetical protein
MDYEWKTSKIFDHLPEKNYINNCCIGGDEILHQLKQDIASAMSFDENQIEIYQEDWGWALEFSKDDVVYLLATTNTNESENNKTVFSAYTQAERLQKGLIFNRKTDATDELKIFSEIVTNAAKKNGFEDY